MQLGIVGLPYSGKSTLFQAITKTHLDSAAMAKSDAHLGVVKVPDERLDRCSALFSPKSTVHATIEFVDVAGLKKGASGTAQFTTGFLSAVKNNDALIQVVRLFKNEAVPHPDGSIDPLRDVATFETEFILADMAVVEARVEKIHRQIGRAHDEQMKKELPVLEKCLALLHEEKPLRNEDLSPEELHILKTYQLLSLKPMLIALSLDESQQSIMEEEVSRVAVAKAGLRTRVVAFFGKIDMEISELSGEEARSMDSGAVQKYLQTVYDQNERMIRSVNDLLEVNRIEDDDLVLRPSPFSILDATNKIVGEYKSFAAANNVNIEAAAAGLAPTLYADEERIKHVMEHLKKVLA